MIIVHQLHHNHQNKQAPFSQFLKCFHFCRHQSSGKWLECPFLRSPLSEKFIKYSLNIHPTVAGNLSNVNTIVYFLLLVCFKSLFKKVYAAKLISSNTLCSLKGNTLFSLKRKCLVCF